MVQYATLVKILSIFYVTLVNLVAAQGQVPTILIPAALELNSAWSPLPFNLTQSTWVPYLFKVFSPIPFVVVYSDDYCPGKMVSIYVNGTLMLNSTIVPQQNGTCDPRIEQPFGTFAFPEIFSHANFTLPQGEHDIAVKVIQSDPNFPTGLMFLRAAIPPNFTCNQKED